MDRRPASATMARTQRTAADPVQRRLGELQGRRLRNAKQKRQKFGGFRFTSMLSRYRPSPVEEPSSRLLASDQTHQPRAY